MPMTLDEIANKNNTDKGTNPIDRLGHGYAPTYERFFAPIREKEIKFLEIGVGGGESIRTWLDFFPAALVFGIDIDKDTNDWNTEGSNVHPRYVFTQGDQSSPEFWKKFVEKHGKDWDVIVDDGGHYSHQIVISYCALWPIVVPGGFYCIEDLLVAYGGKPFCVDGWPNHMDFVKDKLDDINRGAGIEFLHFFKELAIIRKSL